MKVARTIPLALAIVIALGCNQGSSPTEPGPRTVTLAVRQTATIASGVTLSFDRVVSDSRCPSGVACVWVGEVTLALTLSGPGGTEAFTLSDQSPMRVVDGYTVQLISVEPSPTTGSTIPESSYRATIRASR